MKRREFVSRTIKLGTCACAALVAGADPALADDKEPAKGKDDPMARFVGDWTEHLMTVLDSEVEGEAKTRIMEQCGRGCARRMFKKQAMKFKGDVEGFLAVLRKSWAETARFDKPKNVITIAGKTSRCACPLVGGKATMGSQTLCLCSRGWMKEIFEAVTGKTVEVAPIETVWTGGKRCAFRMILG